MIMLCLLLLSVGLCCMWLVVVLVMLKLLIRLIIIVFWKLVSGIGVFLFSMWLVLRMLV